MVSAFTAACLAALVFFATGAAAGVAAFAFFAIFGLCWHTSCQSMLFLLAQKPPAGAAGMTDEMSHIAASPFCIWNKLKKSQFEYHLRI